MFPSLPSSSPLFLLCPLLFFFLLNHSPLASAGHLHQICGKTGKYTTNSTYASNLNLLLTSLDSKTSLSGGFSKATVGQIPNRIYGLALCRGDTDASVCRSCLDTAIEDAPNLCPYSRGAIICRFDKLVNVLMGRIADWAAYNSTEMFATGEMMNSTNPPFPTIYGLAQCTRDLSRSQCRRCLSSMLNPINPLFKGRQGARVLGGSCNYRYEIYSFYEGKPTLRLQSPLEAAPTLVTPPGEEGRGEIVILSLEFSL
ncbi:cysteine-rich receptor-like protein kinase 6 [Phoenix dactylifera]|uniref:Cysteine-rich receptor-like protein kinase 6 n=1 Tax=Phoenix dactylifera TaxID=42345 RepID=A0A8B9A7N0_PHODC|nr:cysteine-rich receptor-like protein kinase 6 [Phoenix dactylifera]